MKSILSDKQKQEIIETLEIVGAEYGIPLTANNILLDNDPLTIIYKHEVIGLCKSDIETKYLEDNDKEALKKCMEHAVSRMKDQLEKKY